MTLKSEELSQSDVRTGTGSETVTQSEWEPDSQAELSNVEEAKKDNYFARSTFLFMQQPSLMHA